jgi:hypothetical protein
MSKGRETTRAAKLGVRLLVAAAAVCVGALVVWGFLTGRNEAAVEAEREEPTQAPLRVGAKNGRPVITVDDETQERSGIETEALTATPYQEKVRAYGMVVDVARLTALSNSYVNAKTQVQTARAKLAMSKPAFERAQSLYTNQRVVSQAALESAEAAFTTDQAGLAAAEAQVRTLVATAYQEWGSVLGKSLVEESPMINRLIERQDFLVQITLPPGVTLPAPPPAATIQTGKDLQATIAFVSPATRVDPKIQGPTFFYTVPAESGVLPGMNVLALLATGKSVDGVRVPASAIVWWQDRAWVYRHASPDTFTREEIATELAAEGGAFIVKNIPPGTEIVTNGAQLLLSEEFRAQIQIEDKP